MKTPSNHYFLNQMTVPKGSFKKKREASNKGFLSYVIKYIELNKIVE